MPVVEIKEVFRRINATRYALNAMEIHNARYEGEFKAFAEDIAQSEFFDRHKIFRSTEVKRMQDTRFVLTVVCTILSTYFNRDDEVEEFLQQYNDEFPQRQMVEDEVGRVLTFIDALEMPPDLRAWKKVDLFTLIVELHRALLKEKLPLDPPAVRSVLSDFYAQVDGSNEGSVKGDEQVAKYYKAALQATNDRRSRIARGEALRSVIQSSLTGQQLTMPSEA